MTRLRVALATVGLLLCCSLAAAAAPVTKAQTEARMPTPIAYKVVCEDQSTADKVSRRIGELIKAHAGYVVRDKFPYAKLVIYINRDVNDRVNPRGYSVAIAHVSNLKPTYLAQRLLVEKPTDDDEVKEVLSSMLMDEGMLEHLSVAHMDEASDQAIDILSRGVLATFLEKTPANVGR